MVGVQFRSIKDLHNAMQSSPLSSCWGPLNSPRPQEILYSPQAFPVPPSPLTTLNPLLSECLPLSWMSPVNADEQNHRKVSVIRVCTYVKSRLQNSSCSISIQAAFVYWKGQCSWLQDAICKMRPLLQIISTLPLLSCDVSARREMLSSSSGTNKVTKRNQDREWAKWARQQPEKRCLNLRTQG